MPVREVYGNWPTSGEIDIVESRGNRDLLRTDDNVQVGKALGSRHGLHPYSMCYKLVAMWKDRAACGMVKSLRKVEFSHPTGQYILKVLLDPPPLLGGCAAVNYY